MAVVAIFLILGFEVAALAPAMFIATYGSSDNSSLLKVSDKNVSGTENDNVTTKGNVFLNQTKDTTGNKTVLAINGSNTTSANGSNAGMLTNLSEQSLAPLQPLRGLLPAPSQSQQQPSSTFQQQPSSTFQQQAPPLQSPLNLIPPLSSPQQQNPLSLMQPSQQLPPPLMQPSQQPFTMIPPSSPLYPVPPFPSAEFNYQPPVILSQSSYVNDIGSMHIVGEVLNQAPATANSVKIIATLYNANGQVIGTSFTYADPSNLAPGQRAPFDILVLEGSVPMYQMSSYGLTVDPSNMPTSYPYVYQPSPSRDCSPLYPDVCIPPPPPVLNCADVYPLSNFRIIGPDAHDFDRDNDGIGCDD